MSDTLGEYMKKIVITTFAILLFSFNTFAADKMLNCRPGYRTYDSHGNFIVVDFPDAAASSPFETTYHSATIMKEVHGMQYAVYVDDDKITMSVAYDDHQSAYGGPMGTQKAFQIGVYFRESKPVYVGKDIADSVTVDCKIE